MIQLPQKTSTLENHGFAIQLSETAKNRIRIARAARGVFIPKLHTLPSVPTDRRCIGRKGAQEAAGRPGSRRPPYPPRPSLPLEATPTETNLNLNLHKPFQLWLLPASSQKQ